MYKLFTGLGYISCLVANIFPVSDGSFIMSMIGQAARGWRGWSQPRCTLGKSPHPHPRHFPRCEGVRLMRPAGGRSQAERGGGQCPPLRSWGFVSWLLQSLGWRRHGEAQKACAGWGKVLGNCFNLIILNRGMTESSFMGERGVTRWSREDSYGREIIALIPSWRLAAIPRLPHAPRRM